MTDDFGLRLWRRLGVMVAVAVAVHAGCSRPPPESPRASRGGQTGSSQAAQTGTSDGADRSSSTASPHVVHRRVAESTTAHRHSDQAAAGRSSARAAGSARKAAGSTARRGHLGPDAIDPYDSYGRLRPAQRRIFGYPVPAALQVTTRRSGLVFGELRAMIRPVEEFYMHRDYLVVRKRNFLRVQPTAAAIDRVLPELRDRHARSTLTIFILGPQQLRFRFEDPDASHPRVSRALNPARRKDAVLPPRPPMVPAYDPDSPNPTRNVPPPPLNPDLPPNKGVRDVRPRIRAWKEAHPDRHFGD